MRRLMPILMVLVALAPRGVADTALADYVNRADYSYAYEHVQSGVIGESKAHSIRLTSQTWQGIEWRHWLTVFEPPEIAHPGYAMLLITGGNNGQDGPRIESGETRILAQIAQQAGTVTAVLEQVPNQPLFDGKTEDEIISLTFEKFLTGEGDDWPLLLPMVKSAVRAMDTISDFTGNVPENRVNKFYVLGGSKRGWTTWLSSVVDNRIFGIAPCVIDTLNMGAQSELQLKSYGVFSDQITDYTERDIQGWFGTAEGQRLQQIVDPFAYRNKLSLPKLVVLGTNDPYWTVDSSSMYFPDLVGEKHLFYGPNVGHDVSPGGVRTIVEFYRRLITKTPMPKYGWTHKADGTLVVTWEEPEARARLWQANAPGRDFRQSQWESVDLEGAGRVEVKAAAPDDGYKAFYVEVLHPSIGGGTFGLCTTITVSPKDFPFDANGVRTTE